MSGDPPSAERADRARGVVIGGSAGAIQALTQILPALPADYPVPIFVVVHMPAQGDNMLAPLFAKTCRMDVREGDDKEPALPGTIYFAPPDYHMLIEIDGSLSFSSDEPVLFSRPSIDVLFESAAEACEERLIGVVLTGASPDGAEGLRAIAQAGGTVLVQDPGTAYATAMPFAAHEACPAAPVLSPKAIAEFLATYRW